MVSGRRNRRVALTLSIGGRVEASARNAFQSASRLTTRFADRTREVNRTLRRQADELNDVGRSAQRAFNPRLVDRFRSRVDKLTSSLRRANSTAVSVRGGGGTLAGGGGGEGGFLSQIAPLGGAFGGGALRAAGAAGPVGFGVAALGGGFLLARQQQARGAAIQRAADFGGTSAENTQLLANQLLALGAIEDNDPTRALDVTADLLREANIRIGEAIREDGAAREAYERVNIGAQGLLQIQEGLQRDPVGTLERIIELSRQLPQAERFAFLDEVLSGTGADAATVWATIAENTDRYADAKARAAQSPVLTEEEVETLARGNAQITLLGQNLSRAAGGIGTYLSRGIIEPTAIALNEWFKLVPGFNEANQAAALDESRARRDAQQIDLTLNVTTDGGVDGETVAEQSSRMILDAISSTGGIG